MITPAVVKALRAVLPKQAPVMPVGGVTPDNMGAYLAAGANGFGIGSALYKPGMTAAQVADSAKNFYRRLHGYHAGMNITSPAAASAISFGLAGRVCIVTGGAQGIGEACARRFARETGHSW